MNKKTAIAITIAVVVVGILVGGSLTTGLFTSSETNNKDTTMEQSDQIQSKDTLVGTGDVAVAGKQVTVHYTGVFASDNKKFDSSRDRGVPFSFTLGAGQVIKGWDIGVEGMKIGGKRILIIPPQFGYGSSDYGPIPGNSTLVFEIELLDVK